MASEEIFVPFAAAMTSLPNATRCKSTLLVSSTRSLQDLRLYDRYLELLDPMWRDTVVTAVAGTWLPIEAAIAHYAACDRLGLTAAEQARVGELVADRMQKSMLITIVRVAQGAGVTPWSGLTHFPRFYHRVFEGGGTRVVKTGPKDARIEVVGLPLARIPYFVHGYRGLIQSGAELFATKSFVTVVPRFGGPDAVAFRLAWA